MCFEKGKGVGINWGYILTMSELFGRHGWLYNETDALPDGEALRSCSGDSPF